MHVDWNEPFFSPPFGNKRTGEMISISRGAKRARERNTTNERSREEESETETQILAVKIKCKIMNAATRSAAKYVSYCSSRYYSYNVKSVSSRRNNVHTDVNVITRRNLRAPTSPREIPGTREPEEEKRRGLWPPR